LAERLPPRFNRRAILLIVLALAAVSAAVVWKLFGGDGDRTTATVSETTLRPAAPAGEARPQAIPDDDSHDPAAISGGVPGAPAQPERQGNAGGSAGAKDSPGAQGSPAANAPGATLARHHGTNQSRNVRSSLQNSRS
jgi:hypothetical protein